MKLTMHATEDGKLGSPEVGARFRSLVEEEKVECIGGGEVSEMGTI